MRLGRERQENKDLDNSVTENQPLIKKQKQEQRWEWERQMSGGHSTFETIRLLQTTLLTKSGMNTFISGCIIFLSGTLAFTGDRRKPGLRGPFPR